MERKASNKVTDLMYLFSRFDQEINSKEDGWTESNCCNC